MNSPTPASGIPELVETAMRADRFAMIENLARCLVTDHLAVRFESVNVWTRDGLTDIAEADAHAVADRANHLMAIVGDAFTQSGAEQ